MTIGVNDSAIAPKRHVTRHDKVAAGVSSVTAATRSNVQIVSPKLATNRVVP
jgi:hypothetical protein